MKHIEKSQSKAEALTRITSRMDLNNHGCYINLFSTNVPHMDKPDSLFLLAKCLKNTCGRVTF